MMQASSTPLATALIELSDLDTRQLRDLEAAWSYATPSRRRQVLVALRELAEDNLEYNFKQVFLFALTDSNPEVRSAAIDGLWEEESQVVSERLQQLMLYDSAPEVRANAAKALGGFAYRASTESIDRDDYSPPSRSAGRLRESLRAVLREAADGSELQLRAIESLAYMVDGGSTDDDPSAPQSELVHLVGRLYREGDEVEQESALVAMGRTMDPRWHEAIKQELDNDNPRIRFQAARAAGEGVLAGAEPALIGLLSDDDLEVRHAAIWALGQLGSRGATEALKAVASTDEAITTKMVDQDQRRELTNSDLREAAEEALGEAWLMSPGGRYGDLPLHLNRAGDDDA